MAEKNTVKRKRRQRQYRRTKKGKATCKRLHKVGQNKRNLKRREEAKQFFGDKCNVCGMRLKWGASKGGLVNLHCIDGTKHKRPLMNYLKLWNKSVLLCSGCHKLIHYLNKRTESEIEDILQYVSLLKKA